MTLITVVFLCLFHPFHHVHQGLEHHREKPAVTADPLTQDIDSMDIVRFDLSGFLVLGNNIIEIPVYLETDDVINALDFSMSLDTQDIVFQSVVDHTGELQFAAYFNPNDLKLRFTSNSFTPYPIIPQRVISVRFELLHGTLSRADLESMVAYLNGDRCTAELQGDDIILSGVKDIITHESFISPNPARDIISVDIDTDGTLDIFDIHGMTVVHKHSLKRGADHSLSLRHLPRGSYTVRMVTDEQVVKVQQIVLQ